MVNLLIKTNKKMKELLKQAEKINDCVKMTTDNMTKLFNPHIVEVHDSVILDLDREIEPEKINFERILLMFQDRTGYEASCNEIRINDYVDCIEEIAILKTAITIMNIWKNCLLLEYSQYRFCLILNFSEGYATLRFHVLREDEHPWLKSDIEEYIDEALLVQEC